MKKSVKISIVVSVLIVIVVAVWIFLMMNKNTYSNNSNTNLPSGNENQNASPNTISISGYKFNPSTLTIKTGDSVTWTNNDGAPHTVTSDSGSELNSGTFSQGESYSHIFNTAGTFDYHCSIHSGMKGKIIVE